MNLKYPHLRQHLLQILTYLADEQKQLRLWVDRTQLYVYAEDYFCDIDNIIAWLEDHGLFDYPDKSVDYVLYSHEVTEIVAVVSALQECLNSLGDAPNEAYILSDCWSDVVSTTARAFHIIDSCYAASRTGCNC
jgi:hypothetical protein